MCAAWSPLSELPSLIARKGIFNNYWFLCEPHRERERESEWKCDYASSYCPFPTASLCALFRVCAFVCISLYLCLTRHEFTHICTAFAFIYLGGTSCADDARRFTEDKQIFSLVYQPFGLGRQINQIWDALYFISSFKNWNYFWPFVSFTPWWREKGRNAHKPAF